MPRILHMLLAIAMAVALSSTPVAAQGGGGSGSSGTGDLFGDLVHIKRSPETGQPILQKRWIEYPKDLFDWGYCPIPVDVDGNEIPFAPLSCDADPAYDDALIEVDMGRLNAARSQPRNLRMHFDEVINKIKEGQAVDRDAAGRLMIGTACTADTGGGIDLATCTWSTIDSPLENHSLYDRLMRYGHIQTDPLEVNVDFQGDPALPTQYYPALAAEDYAKFQGPLVALLPTTNPSACFGASTFTCDNPQPLTRDDFAIAASLNGSAADKTGTMTADIIQYLHRVMNITVTTDYSAGTLNTLPALIRDCGADPDNQVPVYSCTIYPAPDGLPAPANERFVDYAAVQYDRDLWFSGTADLIKPSGIGTWALATGVVIKDYLSFKNPGRQAGTNIEGFVNANLDAVRAVEFLHEYEVPADLGWDFATVYPNPAALAVTGITPDFAAPQPVNRTITFTASATGGVAPLSYKWLLFDGTYWTTLQAWSTSNTVAWTPTVVNPDYRIGVWVRDATSVADAPDNASAATSIPYAIEEGVSLTSLTANPEAPQAVGTSIVFTAMAEGGIAPYEYKWWLFDGSAWTVAQAWGPANTFEWTPAAANPDYRIGVWIRSAGVTADAPDGSAALASMIYPITATAPLTVSGITPNPAPPQPVNTTIELTPAATGGKEPYQFKWFVFDGTAWSLALDWTSDATFSWTPTVASPDYRIGVWARSDGSTLDAPDGAAALSSIGFVIVP